VTSNPANTLYSVVTNLLFLHSFGLHDTVTWNTPSWSISAEFLTNVIFVLPLRYCRKDGLQPRSCCP